MATIISTKTSGVGGLEVTGDASGVLQLASNNGTTAVTVDASQNVGIGTTSPTEKLTVYNGAISVAAAAGTNYTFKIYSNGQTNNQVELGQGIGSPTDNVAWLYNRANADFVFGTNNTERIRIGSDGNVSITQAAGKYTVDTTGGATSVANGGTVDFANASGMLLVNNHSAGTITVYLCGAGQTTSIGSIGTAVGTLTYVSGIAGYRWTNNSGSTATFGFFFVRTRQSA